MHKRFLYILTALLTVVFGLIVTAAIVPILSVGYVPIVTEEYASCNAADSAYQ